MAQQQIMEGTPQQLAALLGKLPPRKRYRIVELETLDSADIPAPKTAVNAGMIATLQEIAERGKGRRHTDGSQTDSMLREGRAGAMWGDKADE